MLRLLLLPCLLGVALAPTLHAGDQAKKHAVPNKKLLDKADELVDSIFRDEIKNAKDAEMRTKLALYLLKEGDDCGDDAAARFVLYRAARELAILAGDAKLALTTVDKTAGYFDVAAFGLKAETLGKVVHHVPTKEPSKALTELVLDMIAEALEADNYAAAVELGKVAAEAAKKAQIVSLVGAVQKRNAEIDAAKERFASLQPFVDRLQKNPADAEANLKMGEYLALQKGKWDRALPLLAKSKDAIGALARLDLAQPKEGKEQLALADAWWDFAAKQPEAARTQVQARAAFWYDKALPNLSGLSRTKAQKRYEQVTSRLEGPQPVNQGPVGFLRAFEGHSSEVRAVAVSPDGKLALSGCVDYSMTLWDVNTGKSIQQFKGHNKQIWDVAFVPHTKLVVSASWDTAVKTWDSTTGKDLRTFSHPLDVNGVAVSRDGRWMLTASDDRYMRLWELAKGEEIRKFAPHGDFCYACAFAPNGTLVASGSKDRRAVVYELATGKTVREFEQNQQVVGVAFSADSKSLFTCGDNAVQMWDIASGKKVKSFDAGGSSAINAMALSADGRRLLTGGDDKVLRVWDVFTGKEVASYKANNTITAVAMTPDGRIGISGEVTGAVRVWGLPR